MVSFVIARRTREIAVRVAIGARARHVRVLVAGEAMGAALAGVVMGLLAGRWLSLGLEHLVYGVEAGNWATAATAAAVLVVVMAIAAGGAAQRALRLPPVAALRAE